MVNASIDLITTTVASLTVSVINGSKNITPLSSVSLINVKENQSSDGYTTAAYCIMVSMSCLMICGVIGNAVVIYVFHSNHRKNRSWSTTDMLIVYLAYIDLILSVFNPLRFIYLTVTKNQWHIGYAGCKIIPTLSSVSSNMSAAMILIIAVDRYRVIVEPFKGHFSKKRIRIACLFALVLSFLTYFHRSYYVTLYTWHGGMYCNIIDVEIVSFLIPDVVFLIIRDMIFLAVFIFTTISIHRSLTEDRLKFKTASSAARGVGKTKKIIRLLITIGVVFTVLVFPREMLHLAFSASWLGGKRVGIIYDSTLLTINNIFKAMQVSNSCVNVFIYAHLHLAFRRTARKRMHSIMSFLFSSSAERANNNKVPGDGNGKESVLLKSCNTKAIGK